MGALVRKGRRTIVGRGAGRPRAAYAGVILGAVLLASSCGQPEASAPDVADTVSVPIQPTIAPLGTEPESFDIDPSAPAAEGLFDAASHLTTTSCAATGGVWSYSGTLENPERDEQTFTVAIILLKTSDMSAVATKEIDLTVAGGAKVPVEAKAFHTSPDSNPGDLECLTGVTVKED